MKDPCCGECRYWLPCDDIVEAIGNCRRYPPMIEGDTLCTCHPETWDSQWCGEFVQAKDGEVVAIPTEEMFQPTLVARSRFRKGDLMVRLPDNRCTPYDNRTHELRSVVGVATRDGHTGEKCPISQKASLKES